MSSKNILCLNKTAVEVMCRFFLLMMKKGKALNEYSLQTVHTILKLMQYLNHILFPKGPSAWSMRPGAALFREPPPDERRSNRYHEPYYPPPQSELLDEDEMMRKAIEESMKTAQEEQERKRRQEKEEEEW